jgi:hypothetical protein
VGEDLYREGENIYGGWERNLRGSLDMFVESLFDICSGFVHIARVLLNHQPTPPIGIGYNLKIS